MPSFLKLLTLALATSLATAAPPAAPVRPSAGGVKVSINVDAEGSGCKPELAHVSIGADNSAMTIIFDHFEAANGPEADSNAKSRAFCRVTLSVNSPGYAFDITSADFRGYVNLDSGVEASLVSRWKWVDQAGVDLKGKGNIQKKIQGPFQDDVLLHKDGELSDNEASICQKKDANVQISLSATVSVGTSTGSGYVQGFSQDLGFGQILNLSWKKC